MSKTVKKIKPLGLLGRRVGMTQVNDEKAEKRVPVSIIETGPCVVLQKKTMDKDGYNAVKLGFLDKKEKHSNKADLANFKKVNTTPKQFVREFRVDADELAKYEEGQTINIKDIFEEGQKIDVSGLTKGRGFTGVFKRWNMAGQTRTHGSHEMFRHGGSIGNCTSPGLVQKNKKMPGHYGVERVTVQNLKVVRILEDKNCILVSGSVPGSNNNLLEIRDSVRYPKHKQK